MTGDTHGQGPEDRSAKKETRYIDLGMTPREAGTYRPPGEDGMDQPPGNDSTSSGSSWLAAVLWLGAALLGVNGLSTLTGSISAMSDPSVRAWGSMGVVMGLGMLLIAAVLAFVARALGKRQH